MMRVCLLLASLVALGAACAPKPPAPVKVVVQGFKYPPIRVAAGGVIEILNKDAESHTLTADDKSFDSGFVEPQKTGRLTAPSKPGSYPITCRVHPTMHGKIVVR